MALFATHIQFALDVKEHLDVKDLSAFLSGTVYPDSRYITKLPRDATHSKNYEQPSFYLQSDFKKGWAMHLYCDQLQYEQFVKKFPEEFVSLPIKAGTTEWIATTALKVLQDIEIVLNFPISQQLDYLECKERPHNETASDIKKYISMIRQLYMQKTLTVTSYLPIFSTLGLSEKLANQVVQKAMELCTNKGPSAMLPMYYAIVEKMKHHFTIKKLIP